VRLDGIRYLPAAQFDRKALAISNIQRIKAWLAEKAKAAIIQFAIDRAGPPIRRRVVSLSPPPENQQGDCGNRQAKSHGAAAMEPRADAAYREITGCEEQETAAADEFGGDQRAPAAGLRVLRHLVPYPAQHDSLETSLSKVRAASLRPSTVVR